MRKALLQKDARKLKDYLRNLDITLKISYNDGDYQEEDSFNLDTIYINDNGDIDFDIEDAPFTKGLLFALCDKLKTDNIEWQEENVSGCDTCGYGERSFLSFTARNSGLIQEFDSRGK